MRVQSAKAKGRRLQQFVADKIRSLFNLHEDDVRSNPMGSSGEDVLLSKAARDKFPFSVECKNVEKLNIWKAIDQCRYNSGDHTPIVVFTKNREETFVALPFEKFLELISEKS